VEGLCLALMDWYGQIAGKRLTWNRSTGRGG
jgi:hypothetical protein